MESLLLHFILTCWLSISAIWLRLKTKGKKQNTREISGYNWKDKRRPSKTSKEFSTSEMQSGGRFYLCACGKIQKEENKQKIELSSSSDHQARSE